MWSNIICWQIFLELFISLFSTRFLHSLTWGCLVASWEGVKKGFASPVAHSVRTALSPLYSAVDSEVFLISSLLRITSAFYSGCRYGCSQDADMDQDMQICSQDADMDQDMQIYSQDADMYADMQSGCRYVR